MPLPVIFRPIAEPVVSDPATTSTAPIAPESRGQDELNDDIGIEEPDTGEASAMMSAIALDVSSRTGAARVALKAMFSARINAAYRSGMNAAQIAAMVRGIKQEMQATLRAAAEAASTELTGRMAAASRVMRGKGRTPSKGGRKHKPG